jgi:hypothetical protein
MSLLPDSQAVFQQLAGAPAPGGVRAVIENHDAWLHADDVADAVAAAMRAQAARAGYDPGRSARIDRQRRSLQQLVTPLKLRRATAG